MHDKLGAFHAIQTSMCLDPHLTIPRRYFFCGSFVSFMACVCHAFASVHCCNEVTCWERADLLALVCDVKMWGQVWYLIVLIPDLCHMSYFSQGHNTVEVGINPLPLTPEIEVLPLGHHLANDQMHSHSL